MPRIYILFHKRSDFGETRIRRAVETIEQVERVLREYGPVPFDALLLDNDSPLVKEVMKAQVKLACVGQQEMLHQRLNADNERHRKWHSPSSL